MSPPMRLPKVAASPNEPTYLPLIVAPNASAQSQYFSSPGQDDPSTSVDETLFWMHGQQRGDASDKDAYFHLNFIITRNLTYKDYGKQRRKVEKRLGKYKI